MEGELKYKSGAPFAKYKAIYALIDGSTFII